ncbi:MULTISPECIES: hypothetical protein [Bacteroidales]|uniref:Response regulatory domain-containing protein n=1 Tax=Parabacteroides hominis TaxID=2763057 RepID=A0ABR7DTK8_9BACT|nr:MULTISPECIES: hypothetical protein [Bacteroidales]MBC5634028.1 hypothetical protein [Parabacteroides hominis]
MNNELFQKEMTNSKLIYIEDDQILGNLITQALVGYGFEVDFRTTLNGLQESLASLLPDLLILDIEVNDRRLQAKIITSTKI